MASTDISHFSPVRGHASERDEFVDVVVVVAALAAPAVLRPLTVGRNVSKFGKHLKSV
jgi:hypothetical protein